MKQDDGLAQCLAHCRLLAFDVDGTLTDSIKQIIACFQRTFTYAHLPIPSDDAIKGTIGMSLRLGIQKLLPDPQDERMGEEITQLYRDTYAESYDLHSTRVFPKVLDTLQLFKDRGYILAIASGKSSVGVQRMLDEITEFNDLFDFICTGDMCESKPSPAMMQLLSAKAGVPMSQILGIGDALLDIQMCQNAGCHILGVLSGVCDYYDLSDAHCEFILPKATDLAQYLQPA